MKFEEAVRKAIKAYYDGRDATNLMSLTEGEPKYTREYFDEMEAELLPSNKKSKKSKKDSMEEEVIDEAL